MWTLIIIGLAFLGWYAVSPQVEAEAGAADAPEAPPEPPAAEEPAGGGGEFESAQTTEPAGEAPAEEPAGEGETGGDDDPFKSPG